MSEILFIVEESEEGGYTARALGQSIYTEGETMAALQENIRDAVRCHFQEEEMPNRLVCLRQKAVK